MEPQLIKPRLGPYYIDDMTRQMSKEHDISTYVGPVKTFSPYNQAEGIFSKMMYHSKKAKQVVGIDIDTIFTFVDDPAVSKVEGEFTKEQWKKFIKNDGGLGNVEQKRLDGMHYMDTEAYMIGVDQLEGQNPFVSVNYSGQLFYVPCGALIERMLEGKAIPQMSQEDEELGDLLMDEIFNNRK